MNGQGRRLSNMTDERTACVAGHAARSMSRKARSPDNARCEGLFGTLKSDFFHGTDWRGVTFAEFRERLGAYIEWHGGGKPKKALGWRALREHRAALGYAASRWSRGTFGGRRLFFQRV